jgi:tRNA A-37 threonylcarbamoyl transferase component Bud32
MSAIGEGTYALAGSGAFGDVVAGLLAADRAGGWDIQRRGMWRVAVPVGAVLRAQGWKLHLSATPGSMSALARLAVPVLVAHRTPFKFPATEEDLRWLNSARCPRDLVGKCLTVYPTSEREFVLLAAELDAATTGLVGPEILTDRKVRPGSVVQYRYGAFTASGDLDDDGRYRPLLRAPDGTLHEDRRDPWFAPPPWAPPPFPDSGPRIAASGPASVLLDGRFLIRRAIRHTAEGGVYEGVDQRTGRQVVIKQARAYVAVDGAGRDCRDRRGHEALMFARLAPAGLAPAVVSFIEQRDRVFLVCEHIEGVPLRTWVQDRVADGVPVASGLALARALVALVEAAHAAGIVVVDISPSNIMVDRRGRVRLVDLDHAAETGRVIHPVGTPGYIPPEHRVDGPVAAQPAADLYGLGALLFLLATGAAPILAAAEPPGGADSERLARWLGAARADLPLVDRLAPAILALTSADPQARRVPGWLRRAARWTGRAPATPWLPSGPPAGAVLDRLVDDAAGWLVAGQLPPEGAELWPSGRLGSSVDRAAVQHGAAGVLAALVAAGPYVPEPDRVRHAVRVAADWVAARPPRPRPGLHYGRGGAAWAVHAAGAWLDEDELRAAGADLAVAIGTGAGNPDVAHGTAGGGLA